MGKFPKVILDFSPSGYLMLCAFLLLIPIPWLLAWLAASLIHECCHLLCLRVLRIPISSIQITIHGARIQSGNLTPGQEMLSASAGPAGSLLLGLLLPVFPRLAVCGIFQACYNLLPLYPMDGGRVLRVLLYSILPYRIAEQAEKFLRGILLLILGLGGLYLWAVRGLGPVPVLFVILLGIKTRKGTFPCKHPLHLLQ